MKTFMRQSQEKFLATLVKFILIAQFSRYHFNTVAKEHNLLTNCDRLWENQVFSEKSKLEKGKSTDLCQNSSFLFFHLSSIVFALSLCQISKVKNVFARYRARR